MPSAQVQFLEGLGIPSQFVCNMASRVPSILGRDPKTELQPVVDYIQKQGVKGASPPVGTVSQATVAMQALKHVLVGA